MKKIAAIIPTFNRRESLKCLLDCLMNQKMNDFQLLIIVVVDGSTDGTMEMIKSDFPNVYVVHGDGSWWYTKSMNEGFKLAVKLNVHFTLTLNDDLMIEEDFVANIFTSYQLTNKPCLVGSITLTNDKPPRIYSSGIKKYNKILDKAMPYFPFLSTPTNGSLTGTHKTIGLPGRGTLIPIETVQNLSFFDSNFKQYHSDADFSLRADKKGIQSYISWDAKVYSNIKSTSSSSSFVKSSFSNVIKSFFQSTSRNYLPDKTRFYWRHNVKILLPFYLVKHVASQIKNNLVKTLH